MVTVLVAMMGIRVSAQSLPAEEKRPAQPRKIVNDRDGAVMEIVPASEFIMDHLQIPDPIRRKFYHDNAAAILGLSREAG